MQVQTGHATHSPRPSSHESGSSGPTDHAHEESAPIISLGWCISCPTRMPGASEGLREASRVVHESLCTAANGESCRHGPRGGGGDLRLRAEVCVQFILDLADTVTRHEDRLKRLEEQARQDSRTSSKPPSADPPKTRAQRRAEARAKAKELMRREGERRKAGGQPGHRGAGRDLKPEDQVDEIVDHYPDRAADADGSSMKSSAGRWAGSVATRSRVVADQRDRDRASHTSVALSGLSRTESICRHFDGHGWVRTSDLSRVKRPLRKLISGRFAGCLSMDVALRARIYCRGLLRFVAVVVHGNDLWTSSSAVLMGTSGPLRNEFGTR